MGCHDPNDDTSFYVVGGTEGRLQKAKDIPETNPGSTHAFILKINAETLQTMWAIQVGARRNGSDNDGKPTTAKAFDCSVQDDSVYFGGIVDDGAGVVYKNIARNSLGGDDIWLASVDVNDANLNWMIQVGSDADDH